MKTILQRLRIRISNEFELQSSASLCMPDACKLTEKSKKEKSRWWRSPAASIVCACSWSLLRLLLRFPVGQATEKIERFGPLKNVCLRCQRKVAIYSTILVWSVMKWQPFFSRLDRSVGRSGCTIFGWLIKKWALTNWQTCVYSTEERTSTTQHSRACHPEI